MLCIYVGYIPFCLATSNFCNVQSLKSKYFVVVVVVIASLSVKCMVHIQLENLFVRDIVLKCSWALV